MKIFSDNKLIITCGLVYIHLDILLIHATFFQSRSIFVKNLNFKTSSESLQKYFVEQVKKGTVSSVKVTFYFHGSNR